MLPFPSVSGTSSCSPWEESAPTGLWKCFSITVLPDALLALCTAPGAAGRRAELKSSLLQRKPPSVPSSRVLYPGAGLLRGSRTLPRHLSLHQAVPPWTAVLMPVDRGCSASACAIQLCCGGLIVPSRQHFSQQSPWAGEIQHSSRRCHLMLAVMTLVFSRPFFFSSYFFEGVALLKARRGGKISKKFEAASCSCIPGSLEYKTKGKHSSGLACGSGLVLSHLACPA